jgi:hypothetical protein
LTAYTFSDQDALQRSGADLVLLPYADAAERGIELLTEPGSADRARAREVAPDDMPGEPSAWSPDSPA